MVADMIAAGLLGYPFICPDMVGGGEWTTFIPGSPFDPELFVRSAQVHALCPMMQFSASPWRVLDAEVCHEAVELLLVPGACVRVGEVQECGDAVPPAAGGGLARGGVEEEAALGGVAANVVGIASGGDAAVFWRVHRNVRAHPEDDLEAHAV